MNNELDQDLINACLRMLEDERLEIGAKSMSYPGLLLYTLKSVGYNYTTYELMDKCIEALPFAYENYPPYRDIPSYDPTEAYILKRDKHKWIGYTYFRNTEDGWNEFLCSVIRGNFTKPQLTHILSSLELELEANNHSGEFSDCTYEELVGEVYKQTMLMRE